MRFTSISALKTHIQSQIDSTLKNEVTKIIAATEASTAEEIVYAAYSPSMYGRRGDAGGLGDQSNVVGRLTGKGRLAVVNQTPFNSGYGTANSGNGLASLVEKGNGGGGHYYDYPRSGRDYMRARPFIQEARRQVDEYDYAKDMLAIGLRDRGLNVK